MRGNCHCGSPPQWGIADFVSFSHAYPHSCHPANSILSELDPSRTLLSSAIANERGWNSARPSSARTVQVVLGWLACTCLITNPPSYFAQADDQRHPKAAAPRPRQDKGQAESTARSSTDRLHHRGPWRAEREQARSIVMREQCTSSSNWDHGRGYRGQSHSETREADVTRPGVLMGAIESRELPHGAYCASVKVLSTRRDGYGGTLSAANTEDCVYEVLVPAAVCCSQITTVSLVNCDKTQAQHVAVISTQRFPVGICNSKVRSSPSRLAQYPATNPTMTILPSRTEFEVVVTRSKVHRMKMAALIPFGTHSAVFQARLLEESQEMSPATPTTVLPRTLIF